MYIENYIENEKLTFSKALLIPEAEDIFILKKDLICNNGTFKAGTKVGMSCTKRGLTFAQYKVLSKDAEDAFTICDEFSFTDVQNFFENTFSLDETATKEAKQIIENCKNKEDELQKRIGFIELIIIIASVICFALSIFIYAKIFQTREFQIRQILLPFISVLAACISIVFLEDTEDSKRVEIRNAAIDEVNAILKDSD